MTVSTLHSGGGDWGTPEDRTLRDMSLSAGAIVKRGTPDQLIFGKCPFVSTFSSKIGEILPVKGKNFSGPKIFSNSSVTILKFCPILPGHMRFLVPFLAK